MSKSLTSDVVIVGSGIIGFSIAHAIKRIDPTLTISVLGDSTTLGGASQASGAMLGNFGELTGLSLRSEAGLTKFDMARKATKLWPEWLCYLSQHMNSPILVDKGTFIISNSKSGSLEDENMLSIICALKRFKEPHN